MEKYTFEVRKKDIVYNRISYRRAKSNFNTDVTIENNKLNARLDRINEFYDRRFNSFTEGNNEVEILDIVSIKYKVGFAISSNFHQIFSILSAIISLFFEMTNIVYTYNQIKFDCIVGNLHIYYHLIAITVFWGILINSTTKCIEIKAKNQDCIKNQKYKKIVFPIASIYFLKASSKHREQLNELVDKIKNINNKIEYKKDTLSQKNLLFITAYIVIIMIGAIVLKNTILSNYGKNIFVQKDTINSIQENNKNLNVERPMIESEEQKELNNKYKIESEIKEKAVGRNIDDLIKELEEKNIQNYSVKYISSKLGVINSVVFVDKNKFCFYVIRDNNIEEMVEMPNLKVYMKKDEIIRLLEEKGLNYEFDGAMYIDKEEYVGTLSTYTFSPGTLIPKGIEVGIGLWQFIEDDEASELNDESYYYEIDIK